MIRRAPAASGTVTGGKPMKQVRTAEVCLLAAAAWLWLIPTARADTSVSPSSLTFQATVGGSVAAQSVFVTASNGTRYTVSANISSGGTQWVTVSPSGKLKGSQKLTVSVQTAGLTVNTYQASIRISFANNGSTIQVPVTLVVSALSSGGGSDDGGGTGGGGTTSSGYKVIGWNDLGMHCMDGQDYSVFAVLPPYNTIHAHVIDNQGTLLTSDTGYTVTYEAVQDPLTSTINTTSAAKTNFWQYAAKLGFGALLPDVGLKGYAMPGVNNTPQAMTFSTADNTWAATGIPILPYADAAAAPYPVNYFPMMRLKVKNSLGTVVATTDIVVPTSDEMTCSACHASGTGTAAAEPAAGWVNNPNPARDVKLNILRKHDDRFQATQLFQAAASQVGYSTSGLEATAATQPILCDNCHASNALSLAGVTGVQPLTTAMHSLHANVVDPVTSQTLDTSTVRDACYRCHPGPKTQCLRGAMGTLKTSTGANAIECQSCHGNLSNVAVATRQGWLDEPNCQSCHTGTAVTNSGQIAYTTVFSSPGVVRQAQDMTFATNPNTPSSTLSLYRFSKGHGGLQCEACHGSTHAEYATTVVNDNVQSTNLQGHVGMVAECTACHASVPGTVTGGPHGLHPIGTSWVSTHQNVAETSGTAGCQLCHGTDYRGTILSRVQADRTMAGKTFPRGTIIGCYSCHNGPNGGD